MATGRQKQSMEGTIAGLGLVHPNYFGRRVSYQSSKRPMTLPGSDRERERFDPVLVSRNRRAYSSVTTATQTYRVPHFPSSVCVPSCTVGNLSFHEGWGSTTKRYRYMYDTPSSTGLVLLAIITATRNANNPRPPPVCHPRDVASISHTGD